MCILAVLRHVRAAVFQAIRRGELSTLEGTLSSLVQPAGVCATNECVQTAQVACCENLTHENLNS